MSIFKKIFSSEEKLPAKYGQMPLDEVHLGFNLTLGIVLAKETPIYEVLEKTIEFIKKQTFLNHDCWLLRNYKSEGGFEDFSKFQWDEKAIDLDYFKSFKIDEAPSYSTIRISGINYAVTISNSPTNYNMGVRLFKQKIANGNWCIYVETLNYDKKDVLYAWKTYSQRIEIWQKYLEMFVVDNKHFKPLSAQMRRVVIVDDDKLGMLSDDFCGFVKTRELMLLVHNSEIETGFFNPIHFWHLWDNSTPIGNDYYLCSRYLDTSDQFEFTEKMIAQTTESYLQDSQERDDAENDAESSETENHPMLSASLGYFSYDVTNAMLDLSVTPSNHGLDARDIEILDKILINGYDGFKVKNISLTYLTRAGALQDKAKIKSMFITLQFFNDKGEWEILKT